MKASPALGKRSVRKLKARLFPREEVRGAGSGRGARYELSITHRSRPARFTATSGASSPAGIARVIFHAPAENRKCTKRSRLRENFETDCPWDGPDVAKRRTYVTSIYYVILTCLCVFFSFSLEDSKKLYRKMFHKNNQRASTLISSRAGLVR